jgi:hypothetical protein
LVFTAARVGRNWRPLTALVDGRGFDPQRAASISSVACPSARPALSWAPLRGGSWQSKTVRRHPKPDVVGPTLGLLGLVATRGSGSLPPAMPCRAEAAGDAAKSGPARRSSHTDDASCWEGRQACVASAAQWPGAGEVNQQTPMLSTSA